MIAACFGGVSVFGFIGKLFGFFFGSLKALLIDLPLGFMRFFFCDIPKAILTGFARGLTGSGRKRRGSRGLFGSTYQERYRHRRRMGYGPAKARRMAQGGCYVATAVYGSYDCPEVWTLRRFRDGRLAQSRRGRLFIRVYYAVSPTLVELFGDSLWFQRMGRCGLDRFVARLQTRGFASTPYEDREW